MTLRKIKRYGWKPDHPFHKRFHLTVPLPVENLPPLVDLRPNDPPIYDQGELGSCTAHGLAAMVEAVGGFMPSRLMIYQDELTIEGDFGQDNGANAGDGIASLEKQGVCLESEWPYDISKLGVMPPGLAIQDALKNLVTKAVSVSVDLNQVKATLASGYRVAFGISVFDSFESEPVAQTGIVPLPQPSENCLGGHYVCAVGYDDSKSYIIFRNSWSSSWGDKGYGYLPYEYVFGQNLASDFWSIQGMAVKS